jgi:hypothetical protein
MAFDGKSVINKDKGAPKKAAQGGGKKPNPYPGHNPQYVPCYNCGQTGGVKRIVVEPGGNRYEDEDDCEMCAALGWVAT